MKSLSQSFAGKTITYRQALFETMDYAMQKPNAFIFGQGVDDFKGIFGTTLGLAEKYGADRVFDTPLAEEGMTGIALGASLAGMYPIQTHIRVDFALLAMNQLINMLAKYKYMSGGSYEAPLLIRMITGRGWGQGSQHSQSIQSLLGHIPGLTVVMPAHAQTVLAGYPFAMENIRGPVISIENRIMFDFQFKIEPTGAHVDHPLDTYIAREGKDLTIVATSIMVLEAQRAAEHLSKVAGIECEVIDLNSISHPNRKIIVDSVKKTGRLVVADTSWQAYGVCAEICRMICETHPSSLKAPVLTFGIEHAPCPTAKSLEDMYYPTLKDITDQIATLVIGKTKHGVPLPDDLSTLSVYKTFKGPF